MSASRIALAAFLLGVTGLSAPAPGAAFQEGLRGQGVSLAVQNDASSAVRVYVLQAGHMVPVGTVQASADSTLAVPSPFLESSEEIQLVVERVGGGTWYRSDPVALRGSSRVALTVTADIEGSSVSLEG